jgi:signal transduction histidine kinase
MDGLPRKNLGSRLDRLLGLPAVADPGRARIGRLVASVAGSGLLAVTLGSLLVVLTERDVDWATFLALGFMAALCLTTLLLVRRGSEMAAARLLFLTGALGSTALIFSGRSTGFSDIALMLYPVLVIMAALFFRRLEAWLYLGLILTLLGATLTASLLGTLSSSLTDSQALTHFGFAVVIVVMSGVASRLMAADIERSRMETRNNQVALAQTNRELQTQAAQREELITELEARNSELQRFTDTVSHDLKSPLVTIGAFVGCIEKDALSDDWEQLLRDLGWIKQAQETMSALLADLLELSRVGRMKNPSETVRLAEIVAEARARWEESAANRGMKLRIADGLPLVTGDRPRLIQMVQSLLENAVKFSGEAHSPVVEIGSRQLDGEIVLYVRDEGIGIEPVHHDKIFELFRQLQPETPGTGLGLALVRKIVEVHGGRVWVESAGDGRGSEFRFTLAYTQTDLG